MTENTSGIHKTYVHTRVNELYADLHSLVLQSRPGTPLPSENALARRYQMARMTVRKALQRIEDEGLIERRRGAGSFVKGKQVVTLLLPCPDFFSDCYAPDNGFYLESFHGVMQATRELGLSLEMVAVSPNNNPEYIDFAQLSGIHAGSLVVCSSWFCNLYEFLIRKGAQVAVLGAQFEYYGYHHFHRDFYTVNCDRRQALRQILDYLYTCGKRRIALGGCYLDQRLHPVHTAYCQWCNEHQTEELIYNFPGMDAIGCNLPPEEIAALYQKDRFDAFVFQHHGFSNVSGTIQKVLGLPPELPVFGIQFSYTYSPGLEHFPCGYGNSRQAAYEAVKLLVTGAQRGTTLTFPFEFHDLPDDWENRLKEITPNRCSIQTQTKET